MEALGIDRGRQDRENAAAKSRRAAAARAEGARTQVREKNDKTVRDSVFDSRHDK
jgi:hypothetical protein